MQIEKTIMKCESIYSEDKEHRILLKREWDKTKESAMVIMINPSEIQNVQTDLTTMCVINSLDKLNVGSVDIFNMYARITNKISFRFQDDEELLVNESDEYMKKSAEKVDYIILAWGLNSNEVVKVGFKKIIDKLNRLKLGTEYENRHNKKRIDSLTQDEKDCRIFLRFCWWKRAKRSVRKKILWKLKMCYGAR